MLGGRGSSGAGESGRRDEAGHCVAEFADDAFEVEGAGLEGVEAVVHVSGVGDFHADHLFGEEAEVEGLGRSLGGSFDCRARGRAEIAHGGVVDVVLRVGGEWRHEAWIVRRTPVADVVAAPAATGGDHGKVLQAGKAPRPPPTAAAVAGDGSADLVWIIRLGPPTGAAGASVSTRRAWGQTRPKFAVEQMRSQQGMAARGGSTPPAGCAGTRRGRLGMQ